MNVITELIGPWSKGCIDDMHEVLDRINALPPGVERETEIYRFFMMLEKWLSPPNC